jgi:PKD repeat protein
MRSDFYMNCSKPAGFACILLLCLLPFSGRAAHIIGGEMTYRFVQEATTAGKKIFEFQLIVYRDCSGTGAALDQPARIAIYKVEQGDYTLVTTRSVNPTVQNVPPIYPLCIDPDNVPSSCVQRGFYKFEQTLDVEPGVGYLIEYQRCCRTPQIVNLLDPSDFGATYFVELSPEAVATGDNSPAFNQYPPTFICNNFDLESDHSANDADGDSLSYEFYIPWHGGGQSGGGCNSPAPNPPCPPPFDLVSFASGYSVNAPMGGNPVVGIDPLTGIMSGRPNLVGQFVVGILVKSYRNGQVFSQIYREFLFKTVDCVSLVVADIAGDEITGPSQFLIRRCGQKTVSIQNQSAQNAAVTGSKWVFDLGNGSSAEQSTWNATITFPDYGLYQGMLILNPGDPCSDTGYISLQLFPAITADFTTDFDTCVTGAMSFFDASVAEAPGGVQTWAWDFGSNGAGSSLPDPEMLYPGPGVYKVGLRVTDANNCVSEIEKDVRWEPHPIPSLSKPSSWLVCMPAPLRFEVFDSLGLAQLAGSTVVWDFGDGIRFGNDLSPEYTYTAEGIYTPSVYVQNPYGCFFTDTFHNAVAVYTSPVADFAYTPVQPDNLNNEVQFSDLSTGATAWDWVFSGSDGVKTSGLPSPLITFADTGIVAVRLAVSTPEGCTDSILRRVDLVPRVRLFVPNVFSPDNATQPDNDRFGIHGILPGYTDFSMTVWSRWGEMVFDTANPADTWNGRTRDGKRLQPGVYVYRISLTGPRGEPMEWNGTVTLL